MQQLQFSANVPSAKFACLLDPWKKSPAIKLTASGDTVTLTVHSGSSKDTWTWADPKDAATPSEIRGTREGVPLVSLGAADKAPKE